MDWWQVALLAVAGSAAGVFGGLFASRALWARRAGADRELASFPPAREDFPVRDVPPVRPAPFMKPPDQPVSAKMVIEPPVRVAPPAPPAPHPPRPKSPLLAELEANLEIATRPWNGQVKSFTTQVWNAKKAEADSLGENIRQDLTEAYTDMWLANRLVWFAEDSGKVSEELGNGYLRIREKIAERLRQVLSSPGWDS
jgi:hypothetical protein